MVVKSAPVVDPYLAKLLSSEPDPVEELAKDQGVPLLVVAAGTAKIMTKQGRLALLACGHFTLTKSLHRARCARCGQMIRAGFDYEAFRHRGAVDDFSWPDDPFRVAHEN